jgi:hypothetical protein
VRTERTETPSKEEPRLQRESRCLIAPARCACCDGGQQAAEVSHHLCLPGVSALAMGSLLGRNDGQRPLASTLPAVVTADGVGASRLTACERKSDRLDPAPPRKTAVRRVGRWVELHTPPSPFPLPGSYTIKPNWFTSMQHSTAGRAAGSGAAVWSACRLTIVSLAGTWGLWGRGDPPTHHVHNSSFGTSPGTLHVVFGRRRH